MRLFRLLLLLLVLFPYLAQAAEVVKEGTSQAPPEPSYSQAIPVGFSFTPPPTDISVVYLSDIFGVVDGVLHGTGSQILGTLFGVFNAVILSIGGVVVSYILFVSTMNTAHHGKVLGEKWSSIWIPIRAVVGIGAMLPKASGYSFVQIFLMWLVVQGIGAADSVWYAALNYFQRGGILVQHVQSIAQAAGSAEGAKKNLALINENARPLLQSQTCMYVLYNGLQNKKPPAGSQVQLPAVPDFITSLVVVGEASGLAPPCYDPKDQRPGCLKTPGGDTKGKISFPGDVSYGTTSLKGVCGTVVWAFANTGGKSGGSINYANLGGYDPRSIAVQQMMLDLQPSAFSLAQIILPTGQGQKGRTPNFPSQDNPANDFPTGALINAATDYLTLMKPSLNKDGQDAAAVVQATLTEAALRGWILAGSYYFTLSRLNQMIKAIEAQAPTNTYPTSFGGEAFGLNPDVRNALSQSALNTNFAAYGTSEATAAEQNKGIQPVQPSPPPQPGQTQAWYQQYPNVNPPSYIEPDYLPGGNIPTWNTYIPPDLSWLQDAVNFIPNRINGLMNALKAIGTSQVSNIDPILAISDFGYQILTTIEFIWIGGAIAAVLMGGLSVCSASNPAGFMVLSFLSWFVPMLTGIMFAMFIAGAIMAFYIPLIPLIVFLFTTIGWFVAVIESMIAGPLVALGIISPEGHEYFGKSEAAIMLILNIFIRPTLIIFGFITAAILVNVALWLWNLAFGVTLSQDVFQHHLTSPAVNIVLTSIAIILIYMTVVLAIVNRCFALIHEIPNHVLNWIGGNVRQFGEESGAGGIEKGFGERLGPVKGGAEAVVQSTPGKAESGYKALDKYRKGGGGGGGGITPT